MDKVPDNHFGPILDVVESYLGVFRVERMNHNVENSSVEKKSLTLDGFLEIYRKQNTGRSLGSTVRYDPEREIIWGIDDSADPPQVYFLKLDI